MSNHSIRTRQRCLDRVESGYLQELQQQLANLNGRTSIDAECAERLARRKIDLLRSDLPRTTADSVGIRQAIDWLMAFNTRAQAGDDRRNGRAA